MLSWSQCLLISGFECDLLLSINLGCFTFFLLCFSAMISLFKLVYTYGCNVVRILEFGLYAIYSFDIKSGNLLSFLYILTRGLNSKMRTYDIIFTLEALEGADFHPFPLVLSLSCHFFREFCMSLFMEFKQGLSDGSVGGNVWSWLPLVFISTKSF